MKKELTPLENWKEVKDYLNYCLYDITDGCKAIHYTSTSQYLQPHIDNVEKALKQLEMEHTLRIRLENINYELVRKEQDNEKKLKALEIIKEKSVSVGTLQLYGSFLKEYNMYRPHKKLTQEEYDLLREVLL